jgi:hypothetical protein
MDDQEERPTGPFVGKDVLWFGLRRFDLGNPEAS